MMLISVQYLKHDTFVIWLVKTNCNHYPMQQAIENTKQRNTRISPECHNQPPKTPSHTGHLQILHRAGGLQRHPDSNIGIANIDMTLTSAQPRMTSAYPQSTFAKSNGDTV